jgi:hypothetical protein
MAGRGRLILAENRKFQQQHQDRQETAFCLQMTPTSSKAGSPCMKLLACMTAPAAFFFLLFMMATISC